MSYIKTNHSGLVKDISTSAVINTNEQDYKLILEKRKNQKTIQHIQNQIDVLKLEFTEIKNLITQNLLGKN